LALNILSQRTSLISHLLALAMQLRAAAEIAIFSLEDQVVHRAEVLLRRVAS
jgi:hypothetical protein